MITKKDYELLKMEIDAKLYKYRTLQQEQDLFIADNICNPEMDDEVTVACNYSRRLQELIDETLDILYELHAKYHQQFAKPVPTSILGR